MAENSDFISMKKDYDSAIALITKEAEEKGKLWVISIYVLFLFNLKILNNLLFI